ncbi:MAG TPA: hypothetical protein VGL93_34090 [Streptosporangiaceae bacterium]|jgi:hypothetical protein
MIHYETAAELLSVDADPPAAIAALSVGELAFVAERAEVFAGVHHEGVAAFGACLMLAVEQEQTRRRVRQAIADARFQEITAHRPDDTARTDDLPPWSAVSST